MNFYKGGEGVNDAALHRPGRGNMLLTTGEEKKSQRSHRAWGCWACDDRMPWGSFVSTKIKWLTRQFLIELFLCGNSYRLFRTSLARDTWTSQSEGTVNITKSNPAFTCRAFLGPTVVTLPLIYYLGSGFALSWSDLQLI